MSIGPYPLTAANVERAVNNLLEFVGRNKSYQIVITVREHEDGTEEFILGLSSATKWLKQESIYLKSGLQPASEMAGVLTTRIGSRLRHEPPKHREKDSREKESLS